MKNYYTALIIVVINVVVFALQALISGLTDSFLLQSSDVIARPWILVTSMFLHGSAAHLLGNMFALGVFGLVLESIIGSRRFLAIYFVSGIVSGIASVFFYEAALGASGAIFGLLGTLAVLRPKMIVWTYGAPMPMFVAVIFWLILDIGGVFYPTSVANIAHIAGLAFGVITGILIRQPPERKQKEREKTINNEEFSRWEEDWL